MAHAQLLLARLPALQRAWNASGREGAPGSVSDALRLPEASLFYEQYECALAAIDSAHTVRGLAPLPVRTIRKTAAKEGSIERCYTMPLSINVSPDEEMELTLIHEVGHLIDYFLLCPALEGREGNVMGSISFMEPLYHAFQETDLLQEIEWARDNADPRDPESDWRYASYLSSPHELFARAYTQWVCLRGDDEWIYELLRQHDPGTLAVWEEEDFEEIACELDRMLCPIISSPWADLDDDDYERFCRRIAESLPALLAPAFAADMGQINSSDAAGASRHLLFNALEDLVEPAAYHPDEAEQAAALDRRLWPMCNGGNQRLPHLNKALRAADGEELWLNANARELRRALAVSELSVRGGHPHGFHPHRCDPADLRIVWRDLPLDVPCGCGSEFVHGACCAR